MSGLNPNVSCPPDDDSHPDDDFIGDDGVDEYDEEE